MGKGDTLLNALIGAGVTVLLSFTGFSPLVGGGVAAYLQGGDRSEGIRVGAISGAVATLPFVLFTFFVFGAFGLFAAGGRGGLAFGAFGIAIFMIVFFFALLWNVGLGAGGGYLGVYIAQEEGIGHYGAQPHGAGATHQGGQQPYDGQQGGGQQNDQWGSGGQQGGRGQRDGDDRRDH